MNCEGDIENNDDEDDKGKKEKGNSNNYDMYNNDDNDSDKCSNSDNRSYINSIFRLSIALMTRFDSTNSRNKMQR